LNPSSARSRISIKGQRADRKSAIYSGPRKTSGRRQTADRKSSIITLKMTKRDLNFKQKSPITETVSIRDSAAAPRGRIMIEERKGQVNDEELHN
jgi:hypothetical protein